MVLRAKTKMLFSGKPLSEKQQMNSDLNLKEIDERATILKSYPRRIVLELTNACNLNCVMCGRNAADFKLTSFDMDIFRSLEPIMDTIEEVTLMGWGEPTIHPHFTEMLEIINRHSARKYFCTNGMNLQNIKNALFDYNVDVFAVSLDGANEKTNSAIRRGSDFNLITQNLRDIVAEKKHRNVKYPYINFVFCAMRSNIDELPELIKLAADIGLEEVKVVYLTAFNNALLKETLWGCEDTVKRIFEESERLSEELGVAIKLPHLIGEDIAGDMYHKDCFAPWRDFFLGSDSYIRPCMSTPAKFFKYDINADFMEIWNSPEFQKYRADVNNGEKMDMSCKKCYQSSNCNWNRKESFIQIGENFSPDWNK